MQTETDGKVRSGAWDGYCALMALVFLAVTVFFVVGGWRYGPVVWKWLGCIAGFGALTQAVSYAQGVRCRLVFGDDGVTGLLPTMPRTVLTASRCAKWAVRGKTLIVWPALQARQPGRHPMQMARLRPGVPLGACWAQLDPARLDDVTAWMTRWAGPSQPVAATV